MHWGPYSQWGIVESWSICSEDEPWCRRSLEDYTEYKRRYEKLKTTFDPVRFDPARWAKAAREAGMKYVVFTTKHHDGFCMFDTRTTDYKITDPGCPFADDPRANVTREIFDAFRKEGLWTGAYFSKPDWHSPSYWWPNFATPDRNPNYDLERYPDRWESFVRFTHAQIDELVSDYGPLDILWLDGGWVRPMAAEEIREKQARPEYRFQRLQSQDIRMAEIVAKAREKQPGLIVVDRAVPGPHQNYLTPENRVPEEVIPHPWESCLILGGGWSYTPDARFRPTREVVHLLVDIVAKGGNLLLNIGPAPDGTWPDAAYERLAGIGAWLAVNGEAIYATRPVAPHAAEKVRFTRSGDGHVYAIYLAGEGETAPPAILRVPARAPAAGTRIRLLGAEEPLDWEPEGEGFVVRVPDRVREAPPCRDAWSLRYRSGD
jgi:alpha-L-fucosidase